MGGQPDPPHQIAKAVWLLGQGRRMLGRLDHGGSVVSEFAATAADWWLKGKVVLPAVKLQPTLFKAEALVNPKADGDNSPQMLNLISGKLWPPAWLGQQSLGDVVPDRPGLDAERRPFPQDRIGGRHQFINGKRGQDIVVFHPWHGCKCT